MLFTTSSSSHGTTPGEHGHVVTTDYVIRNADMQPSVDIERGINADVTQGLSADAANRFICATNVFGDSCITSGDSRW